MLRLAEAAALVVAARRICSSARGGYRCNRWPGWLTLPAVTLK